MNEEYLYWWLMYHGSDHSLATWTQSQLSRLRTDNVRATWSQFPDLYFVGWAKERGYDPDRASEFAAEYISQLRGDWDPTQDPEITTTEAIFGRRLSREIDIQRLGTEN